ncbi:hypothetical protein D3C77_607400 [compost metagenome]
MYCTIINAARQPPQPFTKTSKFASQGQAAPVAQFQAGTDTQATKLIGGHFAYTVQFADGQYRHERFDLIWGNHKQAIGFTPVTGYLGQKLVGRNAG